MALSFNMSDNLNTAPIARNGGSKIRNDLIFIGALVLLAAAVGLLFFFVRGEGDRVTVRVDDEVFGEYFLSENREIEIKTEHGRNYLVIKDGKAYMKDATCPDGICVAHKPVYREGESIVCLPNKVVVLVKGASEDAPDMVG